MNTSSDSTHHCRNPTPTLDGCDLTLLTRTQSSEQEYSYLTASKRHPSTPCSRNTPLSFSHVEPGHILNRGGQNIVYTSLAYSKNFSKICWRVEICSGALRPRRKQHWVSSSFGSIIFATSWYTYFLRGEAKRYPGSWFIHSCFPFCVWGWSICQSFGALLKRYATWHTRVSQTIRRSKFPCAIKLLASSFKLRFSGGIRELIDAQFCGSFHLCKVKTPRLQGVMRLDGSLGKKQVWRPHVRTWGLSEANVLYWRKYLWHCWDFFAPPAVIRRPGNCAPLVPLVTPLPAWKTSLSSVRWGGNVDQRKAPCCNFLFSEVAAKQRTLHHFYFLTADSVRPK